MLDLKEIKQIRHKKKNKAEKREQTVLLDTVVKISCVIL